MSKGQPLAHPPGRLATRFTKHYFLSQGRSGEAKMLSHTDTENKEKTIILYFHMV